MGIVNFTLGRLGRTLSITGLCGIAVIYMGSSACVVDEIPACPGRCFEYTVEYDEPTPCISDEGESYEIPFNDGDQLGYRGRFCFNSPDILLVLEAIDHLNDGGQLDELSPQVVSAYRSTVDAVTADIEAECTTAAAGQCTNAGAVCQGIASDAYQQLIIDATCVLTVGGTEPVTLAPGQVCESVGFDASATESGEHCTETTGDGADDTTAGGSGGADETTGSMLGPFGDIGARVYCDPQTACEVDRDLLRDISTNFRVFTDEQVSLTIVDRKAQCGPGARIEGLDQGEHAQALADALDLRNGDVIGEIESIPIEDLDSAMDAVTSLIEDPSTTLVLRRPEGIDCEMLVYDIEVR